MKCNVFLTILSVLIAALIAYGFYAANNEEVYVLLLSIGAGVTSALTLTGLLGITTTGRTGGANIKALSAIFFLFFSISNLIFSFTAVKIAPYIIVNGILFILYLICVYGIVKSRQ